MFGKRKKIKSSKTGTDTLVGKNTELYGDVRFSGAVRIHVDGTIKGNISTDDNGSALLTLSKQGTIEGEVRVPNIIVDGVILGDVYAAEHIELASNARIAGNVYYSLIEMAIGAEVNGNLVRKQEEKGPVIALSHETTVDATD
ncbi:MAG: polymer-forming cytoskeletal protein [Gammaproteobacteria bacterium]|nr:polymer-forming cytoskeletal protein [Gammaproteobacteria bacterium]